MGRIGKSKSKVKASQPEQSLKYVGPKEVLPARRNYLWWVAALSGSFAVDLVICLALFASIHWWGPSPRALPKHWYLSLSAIMHLIGDFKHDSFDLLLLTVLRVGLLSGLTRVASWYAFREGWDMEVKAGKGPPKGSGAAKPLKPADAQGARKATPEAADGLAEPLLRRIRWAQGMVDEGAAKAEGGAEGHADKDEAEEEDKHRVIAPHIGDEPDPGFMEWINSTSAKDLTLFASFLLCTAFQVYVGAKCVTFIFTREALQGWLMGSAVAFINAESTSAGYAADASGVLGRACALEEAGKRVAAGADAGASSTGRRNSLAEDGQEQQQQLLQGADSEAGARGAAQPGEGAERNGIPGASGGGDGGQLDTRTSTGGLIGHPRKELAAAEDVLRGDRGVREEKVVSPRSYLVRAIGLASGEAPLLLLGFSCLTVTSTAGLVIPHYQGKILDDVGRPERFGEFQRDVCLMALFSLVTGVFGGLRGLCFSVVGKRILKTLQDRLFRGVVIQDIAYFDSTTSGELTSRLTNDVAAMSEPINWQLSALVRNGASLIGGIVLCFWTSWKLSMLAFTTMAPIMHITAVYSRWSRELNRTRYAVLAEANSAASEALGNIRTVRAYSTEDVEVSRFEGKTRAAMLKGVRDAVAYSGAVAINNWLDLGASVLILWYGGGLVMQGRLSTGQLITFQLYWNLIQGGYQSIMSVLTSLTKASGAAQRVLSLIDALPDIDPNAGVKVSTLRGDIDLSDVCFHYQMRPDNPVLRGVTLSVKAGQVCALVGRSGGGKSTLVHLLMRFYDPTSGVVLLDGCDLRSLNLKSVHACMGLVAQDTQMWATSIEENIAYGLPEYTRAQVEEAARYANAHNFIEGFPEGYATRVGERGVRLSGGQRQRIAIARMLLRRPRILVLDEATSSLDTESEALVQEALDRLIAEGGRTIVLVAHRLSTVRNADVIGVIDNGRIVEQGNHEGLLGIPNGVYEKLVRRQLSKTRNTIGASSQVEAVGPANDRIDSLIDDGTEL